MLYLLVFVFFFFKQKTAYEMRISDWSSDVCSSDLHPELRDRLNREMAVAGEKFFVDSLSLAQRFQFPGRKQLHPRDQKSEGHRQEIGRASCRERVCQYV